MRRRGVAALVISGVLATLGTVGVSVSATPAQAATTAQPLIVARRTATDLTWSSTLDYGKTAHGIYHYGKPDWTPVVWYDGKIGAVETAGGELVWHLSNDNKTTHGIYHYGKAGDTPIIWGNGLIGYVHDNGTDLEWHLSIDRKTTHGIYKYGKHGDRPIVWGPGLIGFVRDTGTDLEWHLSVDRKTTHGIHYYGKHGDTPVSWGPGLIGFTRPTAAGLEWHISVDRKTTHGIFTFGAATATGLGLQVAPQPATGTSPLRSAITRIANGEVGYQASASQCQKYGPLCDDWCAMFVIWVWDQAGVPDLPDTYVARGVGRWGVEQHLFKSRPSGGRGNPEPGDLVIYGTPVQVTGGHVSIVYSVNSDGTLTTIDGNFNNTVAKRVINPVTARAGGDNLLISGYVSPPGL
jgi:hypothetical protein